MGKIHRLPEFKASISTQGDDKHLHLPRKLYGIFDEKKLLGKKLKVRVTLETI